jgi:hypothetical protein
LRRLALGSCLVFGLGFFAAGCSSEAPREEKPAPAQKPASSTPPPARTPPPAQPKEAAKAEAPPPADEDVIVIKKKPAKTDAGSSTSTSSDPSRQARIDELNAQARASQGKDNGKPYREEEGPAKPSSAGGKSPRRQVLESKIAELDREASSLQAERKGMIHEEAVRQGRMRVNREVNDNPDRTAQIDQRLKEIDGEKAQVQKDLAAVVAEEKKAAKDAKKDDKDARKDDKGDKNEK